MKDNQNWYIVNVFGKPFLTLAGVARPKQALETVMLDNFPDTQFLEPQDFTIIELK